MSTNGGDVITKYCEVIRYGVAEALFEHVFTNMYIAQLCICSQRWWDEL
jgi:hypothetical protein